MPSAPYHGYSGPVAIQNKVWETPVAEAFLAGGRELGYPGPVDYNAKEQLVNRTCTRELGYPEPVDYNAMEQFGE